jgi:hypothetical protein
LKFVFKENSLDQFFQEEDGATAAEQDDQHDGGGHPKTTHFEKNRKNDFKTSNCNRQFVL